MTAIAVRQAILSRGIYIVAREGFEPITAHVLNVVTPASWSTVPFLWFLS